MANPSSPKKDTSHVSFITDQLTTWEVNSQLLGSADTDNDVANRLLRSFSHVSRFVRKRVGAKPHPECSSEGYLRKIVGWLSLSWDNLRSVIDSWTPPSGTMISYARMHNHGCPWSMTYFTRWSAMCVVMSDYLEIIPVSPDVHELPFVEIDMNTDYLAFNTNANQEVPLDSSTVPTNTSFRHTIRLALNISDPYPRWRCVAVSQSNIVDDPSIQLIAIGNSNGSVEVLSVCLNEANHKQILQKRISIPPPCVLNGVHTTMNPVVFMRFLTRTQVIICYFSGHVDFWYIDWNAKRFPERLLARLFVNQHNRSTQPLTTAAYDANSKLLFLCKLPKHTSRSKKLHENLGLSCFHVTEEHPFLTDTSQIDSTTHRKVKAVHSSLSHALSGVIQYIHATEKEETDAIAFLQICSTTKSLITVAALQCSGTCSVWSAPNLEPLFILLDSQMSPSNNLPTPSHDGRPFRLCWWAVSTNTEPNNAESEDVVLPELIVLREDGCITMLKFHAEEVQKLSVDGRLLSELNLASFPIFVPVLTSGSEANESNRVVIVDKKRKSTRHIDNSTQQSASLSVVRAVRLSSSTPMELYRHFIATGRYDEALDLADLHGHDKELVFQQRWLDTSGHPQSLSNLPNIIEDTLSHIHKRTLWVIKQCVHYLPNSSNADELVPSVTFFSSLHCLLEHGLERVKRLPEELAPSFENQFLRRLDELSCLEEIMSAEFPEGINPSEKIYYSLLQLTENLKLLRNQSPLEVTMNFVQSNRFQAAGVLVRRLPRTVGQHRLALASLIRETVSPKLFVTPLLNIHFPQLEQVNRIYSNEPEQNVIDQLYAHTFRNASSERRFLISDHPLDYASELACWLLKRARQIEAETGLVSHAIDLLDLGEDICLRLVSNNLSYLDDKVNNPLLGQLRELCMLRLDLALLAKIIYHKPRFHSRRPKDTVYINSRTRHLPLARFDLQRFLRLGIHTRIDIMLQVSLPELPLKMDQSLIQTSLDCFAQILIYLAHIAEKPRHLRQLIAFSLERIAFYQGLAVHTKLTDLIQSGTVVDLLHERSEGLFFGGSWKRLISDFVKSSPLVVSDSDILDGIIKTIYKYQPTEAPGESDPNSRLSVARFKSYLSEVSHLIQCCLRCTSVLEASGTAINGFVPQLNRLAQSASGLKDLLTLTESFEKIGSVHLGVKSVGDLARCFHNSGRFQNFLAYWISSLDRLVKDTVSDEESLAGDSINLKIKSVSDLLIQIRQILLKTFHGYPAERWLSIGLEYSLLSAGSERMLQLALTLINLTDNSVDRSLCLLYALRSYVDASVPAACLLPDLKPKPLDQLDPNERMARHCLQAAKKNKAVPSALDQEFELEEHLLDASSFFAHIAELLPNTQHLVPTSPFRLRSLWIEGESANRQRTTLFCISMLAMLKSLRKPHAKRRSFVKLIQTNSRLFALGRLFLFDSLKTSDCLMQAAYKYFATAMSSSLSTEIVDHILELLVSSVLKGNSSSWLGCAQWAGGFCEDDTFNLSAQTDWTGLHALFHIGRSSSSGDLENVDSLAVEAFRVWLARFALAHCPSQHLSTIEHIVSISSYRLDTLLPEVMENELSDLPTPVQSVANNLLSLIHSRMPRHSSFNCLNKSAHPSDIGSCIPYFYLPYNSPTPSILEHVDRWFTFKPISSEERNLWRLFARQQQQQKLKSHSQSPTETYFPRVSSSVTSQDSRLALAYALSATHLGNQPSLEQTFSVDLESLDICDQEKFLRRAQLLVISCFAFSKHFSSPIGCFPAKSSLLELCSDLSLNNPFHSRYQAAIAQCLFDQIRAHFPDLNVQLFLNDQSYRLDIIQTISATHLHLGVRLAACFSIPLDECIHARLAFIFLSASTSSVDFNSIYQLFDWVIDLCGLNKFHAWCANSLYPSLDKLDRLDLFFNLCDQKLDLLELDSVPVATHRNLINVLRADDTDAKCLLESISYSGLINSLRALPFDDTASFKEHPLFPFLLSRSTVDVVRRLMDSLSQDSHARHNGDLYAVYAIKISTELQKTDDDVFDSILCEIAPSDDPSGPKRLLKWLKELVYSPEAKDLSITFRQRVLQKVATFMKKLAHSTAVDQDIIDHVNSCLDHFEAISSCEALPMLDAFLVLPPGDEIHFVHLLESALHMVVPGPDEKSTPVDAVKTTLSALKWFSTTLPTCFSVLRLSHKAQKSLSTKALGSLPRVFASPFERILSAKFDPSPPELNLVHTELSRFVEKLSVPTTDLLGFLLIDQRIRRMYGRALWTQWGSTWCTALDVLLAALRSMPCSLDLLCADLDSMASESVALDSLLLPVTQFLSSNGNLDDEDWTGDFLLTLVELIELLWLDAAAAPAYLHRKLKPLWNHWFRSCQRRPRFNSSPESLLFDQWTQLGRQPPLGLAQTCLEHLRSESNLTQPVQIALANVCLCQSDRSFLDEVLSTVQQLPEALIDLDVCRHIVCSHGSFWPSLVQPEAHHPVLFTRIFHAVEEFSPRHPGFAEYAISLLRDAGLWIEASRLARTLTCHLTDSNSVPLSVLVTLVTRARDLVRK